MVGIAFLLLLSAQFVSGSKCQSGWTEFQGRCYSFYGKAYWEKAERDCNRLNARIAEVNNMKLNQWLVQVMKHLRIQYMWIGAVGFYFDEFTWIPSGITLMPFEHFHPQQQINPELHKCALLSSPGDNWWLKEDCSQNHTYICMKQIVGSTCELGSVFLYKGMCFSYHFDRVEWEVAVVKCNDVGADLAEIGDLQLNTKLASDVYYINWPNRTVSWIGGSTLYSGGDWVWIVSHRSMEATFLNWRPLEAKKRIKKRGGILIDAKTGKWESHRSTVLFPYVCEKDIHGIVYSRFSLSEFGSIYNPSEYCSKISKISCNRCTQLQFVCDILNLYPFVSLLKVLKYLTMTCIMYYLLYVS